MTTFVLAARPLEFFFAQYRRVWRGTIISTVVTPVVYLLAFGYGLGTRLGDTAGHRKLGHTGGGTSNKAVLARYPDDDVTIAVLLNTEAYNARVTATPSFPARWS